MSAEPNAPIPVGELNRRARQALERAIPLLWVIGEISNLVRAASGHVYFTLKDEQAQVRCVMFRSRTNLVPWQLENGQQVEVQALVSIYEARGDFQLGIEAMRRAGLGRLYEAFARLKEKLEREGLFSPDRKQLVPRFPRAIGVVASLQAAALRDVIAACTRRAPHLQVIVFPTLVQGNGATEQIARAIDEANRSRLCDVLIVARGGGSIEDMWAFNEEVVARAITASSIPVISGVGHETDITITDFVADQRAATPTAAAELATAGWFAAANEIRQLATSLHATTRNDLESQMQHVDALARRLLHPRQRIENINRATRHLGSRLDAALHVALADQRQKLGAMSLGLQRQHPDLGSHKMRVALSANRLQQNVVRLLGGQSHRLGNAAGALALLDPQATLARGYSIARNTAGQVIRSSDSLVIGDSVRLSFAKGQADTTVTSKGKPV